jgi:hypothetical protein
MFLNKSWWKENPENAGSVVLYLVELFLNKLLHYSIRGRSFILISMHSQIKVEILY